MKWTLQWTEVNSVVILDDGEFLACSPSRDTQEQAARDYERLAQLVDAANRGAKRYE